MARKLGGLRFGRPLVEVGVVGRVRAERSLGRRVFPAAAVLGSRLAGQGADMGMMWRKIVGRGLLFRRARPAAVTLVVLVVVAFFPLESLPGAPVAGFQGLGLLDQLYEDGLRLILWVAWCGLRRPASGTVQVCHEFDDEVRRMT